MRACGGCDVGQLPEADRRKPVLIAEDEYPIALVLAGLVADAGYRALVARNGRQALELVRGEWPALVITNLMMPQLDGAGLIATLRKEAAARGLPAVPVILVTAAEPRHSRGVGADVTLPKPFDLAWFDDLLVRYLGPAQE